jgi:hypothetical protein
MPVWGGEGVNDSAWGVGGAGECGSAPGMTGMVGGWKRHGCIAWGAGGAGERRFE